MALPVTAPVCGLLAALSDTDSVALRLPLAVGLKVRVIVQFDPALRLVAQLLVSEKSPELVPAIPMLEIDIEAVPLLLSVILSAPLEVETS